MRLQGKVAIVTGAASGIGKASAALFEAEGAKVIRADVSGPESVIAADAGREEDVRGLIDQAVRDHGGLDIFFANAGVSGVAHTSPWPPRAWSAWPCVTSARAFGWLGSIQASAGLT